MTKVKPFRFQYRPAAELDGTENPREIFAKLFGIEKLSDAVEAMLFGILEHIQRSDFRLNMSFFGETVPARLMCYGCAATAALGVMLPRSIQPTEEDSGTGDLGPVVGSYWWRNVVQEAGHVEGEQYLQHLVALHTIERWYDRVRQGCTVLNDTWTVLRHACVRPELHAEGLAQLLPAYWQWISELRGQKL